MISLLDLYNWLLLNFLWIGIGLLIVELILWYLETSLFAFFAKWTDFLFENPNITLLFLGVMFFCSVFIKDFQGVWFYNNEWNGESTRSFVFAIGALGALYGLFLAYDRLRISDANLFNDRLSRAIEAIGHKTLPVRNAGLRLLHNLGNEVPQNSNERQIIVNILHGYIRDKAMKPESLTSKTSYTKTSEECAGIVLAIQLLFDLVPINQRRKVPLDNLDFSDYHFKAGQDLERVSFRGANFKQATMDLVNLKEANLSEANLDGAILGATKFQKAYLTRANLENASVIVTKFQGANLSGASFKNVNFIMVDFEGARLWSADFSKAIFSSANFFQAELQNSDFSSTKIHEENNLTQEQLDTVLYEKGKAPKIPKNLILSSECEYEKKIDEFLTTFINEKK